MVEHSDIMRELGGIGARLKSLEKRQGNIEVKLGHVHDKFQRLDGGKKMGVFLLSVLGAISGAAGAVLSMMTGKMP